MDKVIKDYLDEKIQARIKTKVKKNMTDEDILEVERAAKEEFSLGIWLPNASKRANQLSLVSHNGKLTHTGVKKESAVLVSGTYENDGYLRTGNIEVDLDIIGNAAALDVYKFLSLILEDGRTILKHLEVGSSKIKAEFDIPTVSFDEISKGLLSIKKSNTNAVTSNLLKQVYFPIEDENYHLLSLLTPSGILYKLKEKISNMKFSEETKGARNDKKDNKINKKGYSDIYDLTVIGFGGTKPQNAGNLSNQNGGRAYLLSSMPPELFKRDINPPRISFFSDTLDLYYFKKDFEVLYHLLEVDRRKNKEIRDRRDNIFKNIINKVISLLWRIRELEPGWSDSDYYKGLDKNEKVWLDQFYADKREENISYLENVKQELLKWIIHSYSNFKKNKKIVIPEDVLSHLEQIINDYEGGLR